MTSVGVTIIFLVILAVFAILDIVMLVTLSLPGDARIRLLSGRPVHLLCWLLLAEMCWTSLRMW